jgi:hypothetical protein
VRGPYCTKAITRLAAGIKVFSCDVFEIKKMLKPSANEEKKAMQSAAWLSKLTKIKKIISLYLCYSGKS